MAVRVIATNRRDMLGEGPLWSSRDQTLYWVDILGKSIQRVGWADQRVDSFDQPDHAAWVVERQTGGLIAGVGPDIVALDLESGGRETVATVDADIGGNRLNDAKADALGRIWFGTMPVGCDRPSGSLYRLDPDGRVARVDAPYTIANGPAIDPEGAFLLHTDTALRTIFRFEIREDGSLGTRHPFVRFDGDWGNPDGMCFDANGGLWVACWGASRVMRFTPGGAPDRSIELPASQITSCAFAGPRLDRMVVTSASHGVTEAYGGALFEIDPGCRGLPASLFGG